MTDLNRKENSPIMRLKRDWELMLLEEEPKASPDLGLIQTCKAEIKNLGDMLDRLELNK